MHLELWCQEVGERTRKCMMSIWTVRVRVEKGQSKQNRSGLIVRKRMRPRSKCCSVK